MTRDPGREMRFQSGLWSENSIMIVEYKLKEGINWIFPPSDHHFRLESPGKAGDGALGEFPSSVRSSILPRAEHRLSRVPWDYCWDCQTRSCRIMKSLSVIVSIRCETTSPVVKIEDELWEQPEVNVQQTALLLWEIEFPFLHKSITSGINTNIMRRNIASIGGVDIRDLARGHQARVFQRDEEGIHKQ
jgi:hypothetical protein